MEHVVAKEAPPAAAGTILVCDDDDLVRHMMRRRTAPRRLPVLQRATASTRCPLAELAEPIDLLSPTR